MQQSKLNYTTIIQGFIGGHFKEKLGFVFWKFLLVESGVYVDLWSNAPDIQSVIQLPVVRLFQDIHSVVTAKVLFVLNGFLCPKLGHDLRIKHTQSLRDGFYAKPTMPRWGFEFKSTDMSSRCANHCTTALFLCLRPVARTFLCSQSGRHSVVLHRVVGRHVVDPLPPKSIRLPSTPSPLLWPLIAEMGTQMWHRWRHWRT